MPEIYSFMFNLNESNQFFISNAPTDMRVGVNAMCGKVRQASRNPTDGKVYVFVGKTRKVMKRVTGYSLWVS